MSDSDAALVDLVLGAVASGRFPALSWLDGGPRTHNYLGLDPSEEVRAASLDVFDELGEGYWIGWVTYEGAVCMRRFAGLLTWRGASVAGIGASSTEFTQLQRGEFGRATQSGGWPLQPLQARLAPQTYRARVEAAAAEIRCGNTYQVNLSQRFGARWCTSVQSRPLGERVAACYASLRRDTPAQMGALVLDRELALVSNSPETLLRWEADEVVSSPIKGTRPRGRTPHDDRERAQELLASEKDAAEHVMIVDLVRNDLGTIARPGSVTADPRPQLVSLPTVHHLVTDVRARVCPKRSRAEVLRALFPGGSITGAPKRATMQLIESLECEPRGLYCGGFVLITPTNMVMSIAIRSGTLGEHGLRVRAGGGIVLDSDPEAERIETLDKMRAFARGTCETSPL